MTQRAGFTTCPPATTTPSDVHQIVRWINTHLGITWVELEPGEPEALEPAAIRALRPPFNDRHNPDRLEQLSLLRTECRRVAREQTDNAGTINSSYCYLKVK